MRSVSSPRAVNIRTGVSVRARIRRQTSKPSRSGSMTSRSTAWNAPPARRERPFSARGAIVTSKPFPARYSETMAARCASSSIMRIRSAMEADGSAPVAGRARSALVVLVDPLGQGLALLGSQCVGYVGQGLHEPLGGFVRQPHLRLADLLQGGAVDGSGAAELGVEGITVLLVLLPEPEEVVHRAVHDPVDLVLLLAAGVDVPQHPLGGDLEVFLGCLRAHGMAATAPVAAPPMMEPARRVLDGGGDRPRGDQGQEGARPDRRVQNGPTPPRLRLRRHVALLLHRVLRYGRAPTASRE